jgi:hypothetical protein
MNTKCLWCYSLLSELIYYMLNIVMRDFWYYHEHVVLDIFLEMPLRYGVVIQYFISYHWSTLCFLAVNLVQLLPCFQFYFCSGRHLNLLHADIILWH